jgi:CRISPR-associated protein Csh1
MKEMIAQVENIGKYVCQAAPEKSSIDAMLNSIEGDSIKNVLEINVTSSGIETKTKEFYKDVVKDALFYQAGRGFLGGGIRLDFYKESKVKAACEFCEIRDREDEIRTIVEDYKDNKSKETFAIIKVNGKTPRELFLNKFLDSMYSTSYKKIKGKGICHLCGKKDEGFNTTSYKFYTNDKSIYGNVDNKDEAGFVVCKSCLNNIILGRDYIDKYLSTYWINKSVMFLPHKYNEDMACIYEAIRINEKQEKTKFLNTIRINEEEVIDEIGKTDAVTDVIFYQEDSKFFYIYYVIQSVLPSRFTLIAQLLKHYELKLFTIFNYAAVVKVSLDNIEMTDKEQMRILDAIFSGKKIERSLFFKRALDVYKYHYLKEEHKKFACMRTINRIYNFLNECGCLEKGWNAMINYKNYGELFLTNPDYFNSNEKKAWFILGKAYGNMIYYLKSKNKDGNAEQERTTLEKNFFFSRKFDFNDFIYFCNLLEEKAIKYNQANGYFKKLFCEAKDFMARKEGLLSFDEAKYLFFWGMDSYFKNEDETAVSEENQSVEV